MRRFGPETSGKAPPPPLVEAGGEGWQPDLIQILDAVKSRPLAPIPSPARGEGRKRRGRLGLGREGKGEADSGWRGKGKAPPLPLRERGWG